jgi:mRNA interferase MazF
VTAAYLPDRHHLIWLDFDPQAGREQRGRRPALVLSPQRFNRLTGFALVCPVTSRSRGWRFEVLLPVGLPITGVVLADQARTLDWRDRSAEFVCAVPEQLTAQVIGKFRTLLD